MLATDLGDFDPQRQLVAALARVDCAENVGLNRVAQLRVARQTSETNDAA